jgi:hypothetical protein
MKVSLFKIQLFVLLIFANIALVSGLKAQYPTDSAKIYLITLSPGSETYAAFGHSALRVSDPHRGFDYVYNYGTFDFETSNFYLKFGFGRLMYFLSISNYNDFYTAYKMWGQAMWEQKLNLTNKEKWQLMSNLQKNYQTEERFYRYGFFRDNCSTRIRDIIEKSVDGKLLYDTSFIKRPESFRMLFSAYLQKDPWVLFGIDILLGKGTDSIAGIRDYMFLPANMMNLFTSAKISDRGTMRPLSQNPVLLYPTTLTFDEPNPLTSPVAIFCALLCIVLIFSFIGFKKNRYFKWFDVVLYLITGLLGLLLFVMMLFSWHPEVWTNSNIVWANPVNLVFAVGLIFSSKARWLRNLLMIYGVALVVFIPLSLCLKQHLPSAAYPIMGILIVRVGRFLFKKS